MNQDNKIYIYENNFVSLISLIKILIENNIRPFNIKDNNYIPNLLDEIIHLKLDNDISDFLSVLGKSNLKVIYYVYLSNNINKELIIFYYVLNSLKYNEKTIYMRNLKCVTEALKISKYVSRENHRFKGFTRFKELKNKLLYAQINPENNILELLSYHFKERLKSEYWVIKDVKRNILSFYDKDKFYIVSGSEYKLLDLSLSDYEEGIINLWKSFYDKISIKERYNERCRMNFMPKKYWQYIVEVEDI